MDARWRTPLDDMILRWSGVDSSDFKVQGFIDLGLDESKVDPSIRALSGRLKFTVRRHKFHKDSLSLAARRRSTVDETILRSGLMV